MQDTHLEDAAAATLHVLVRALIQRDDLAMSAHQLAVFLSCYMHPEDHTVRGLAEDLHTTRVAITRAVDRLSDMGLLLREESADDPRHVVVLRTRRGWDLMREIRALAGARAPVRELA